MWPQHLQQSIFDVKGLPPPLELTSGNDLGGLERSLEAYCTAFQVQIPTWTIDWDTPYQPTFRLLPLETPYTPLQLLAVFRALRYNSYFKGISLRGTDLSSLYGKRDKSSGDAVVHTSSNGKPPLNGLDHHILTKRRLLNLRRAPRDSSASPDSCARDPCACLRFSVNQEYRFV
jgi:hypothetical protein